MTTYAQANDAADRLARQVQDRIEDPRFGHHFDRLFGLRTRLGTAAEAFARSHGSGDGELPLFARVLDRCDQALSLGGGLRPDDAGVAAYAGAVDRATDALGAGGNGTGGGGTGALRGTLRLDPGRDDPPGIRPLYRSRRSPEPYYASLVKLFPVEAVTLYPLALGIAAGDAAIRLLLIGVIAAFVVVLRWFGTQQEGGGAADKPAVAVAVASFLLYAASLGGFGWLPGGPEQTRQLLAFLTVMWVALVPVVLRRARC